MKEKNIHYYPGHMKKAENEIAKYVQLVDLIVEVVDARAPLSCRNPFLEKLLANKKHLLLLSKSDYSDPSITNAWVAYFAQKGITCLSGNLKKDKILSLLTSCSESLFKEKREKEQRLGMKRQPLRLMVIGVPNVGKSTFINSLKGKGKAKVGNKAGVTRSEQWIKVSADFLLLDTPGVLPMNYAEGEAAIKLALLGTMREDVLPTFELAEHLFGYLSSLYPLALQKRYEIADLSSISFHEAMEKIAERRGLLVNGAPSADKGAILFLKEFQNGLVGNYSLEVPNAGV